MPDIPPIDDLTNLSATGAMLEGVLRQWVQEITECSPPDIVTFTEAVDLFSRLTAIRKTLIKLSRLTAPRPNNPSPEKRSRTTELPSSTLPEPNIPQIPCVPDVPYDQLRPQLDAISTALQILSPYDPPDLPSDPSDPSLFPHTSHTSHTSHSPDANPQIRNPSLPRDPRCVALNIHPLVEDTSGFPDNHPFFDRFLYNPKSTSPWHRKKTRRFG